MAPLPIAKNSENDASLMIVMINVSPSIVFKDKSHAMALAPRFARMINLLAFASSMSPELTIRQKEL